MDLSERREIRAAPAAVWAAIFDPEVLRLCIPGCEAMTGNRKNGYNATIRQKIGPISVLVKARLTVSDIVEGETVTITGHGKGRASGLASGKAKVTLAPSSTGTTLDYDVTAKVEGKIMSLGGRFIDGAVRRMADQFFTNLKTSLEAA